MGRPAVLKNAIIDELQKEDKLTVHELNKRINGNYSSVCSCIHRMAEEGVIHRHAGPTWSLKAPAEGSPSPFRMKAVLDEIEAGNNTKEGIIKKLGITEQEFYTSLTNIRNKGIILERAYVISGVTK